MFFSTLKCNIIKFGVIITEDWCIFSCTCVIFLVFGILGSLNLSLNGKISHTYIRVCAEKRQLQKRKEKNFTHRHTQQNVITSVNCPRAGTFKGGAAFCKYTTNTHMLQGNDLGGKLHTHLLRHTDVSSSNRLMRSIIIDEMLKQLGRAVLPKAHTQRSNKHTHKDEHPMDKRPRVMQQLDPHPGDCVCMCVCLSVQERFVHVTVFMLSAAHRGNKTLEASHAAMLSLCPQCQADGGSGSTTTKVKNQSGKEDRSSSSLSLLLPAKQSFYLLTV